MDRKEIAIVGAGISGLLACKYVLSKGFHPVVFESQDTVGGLWTKTFQITKLQTPRTYYEFSDFSWPASVEDMFPTGQQVLGYVQAYADHFDLIRHVRFNTKVVSISYDGPKGEERFQYDSNFWGGTGEGFSNMGKWSVTVEDLQTRSIETMLVDFVILCVGRFSGLPNMPEFPENKGPQVFDGKVIHSMDYASLGHEGARDLVKGKRVTVVGYQKSALDITMESSMANGVEKPCTLICRTPQWNVLDYLPWGFPLAYLYLNRFSEMLVHKPGEGLFLFLLALILSPIRWAFAKFVESDLKHRIPLTKYGMVPEHSFLQQANTCLVSTYPAGFFENVEKGSIVLKKTPSFCFCKDGILIEGQEKPIETDLVILATGFKGDQKLSDIIASSQFKDQISPSSNISVPLYRECIHPRIPQVAMIGFSESLSNLFTFEMRCRWLAELLDGTFKLPTIQDMEKDILRWDKFKKQYAGPYYRRSCIGAVHIWYNDQLCNDMGWNPKRKKSFFSEMFEPYGPMDYAQK